MKRQLWYRWLFLVLAGGALFQTNTSCSAQFTDAITSSLASSLSTIVQDMVTSTINQALGTSSAT